MVSLEDSRPVVIPRMPLSTGSTVEYLPCGNVGNPRSNGTRAAIMSAARKAFSTNGLQATRLASVARSAWVAPSTVSMHFKGKEALFAACLDEEIDWLFDGAFSRIGGHPYPLLSGDLLRILSRRLSRYPLLSIALATSPNNWGKRYYESARLGEMCNFAIKDLTRARESGFIRPDINPERSGRELAEIQSWSLWTATLQPDNFEHVERIITATKSSVMLSSKIKALHVECRSWRTAASSAQGNTWISSPSLPSHSGSQQKRKLRSG